jgi:galactokinase
MTGDGFGGTVIALLGSGLAHTASEAVRLAFEASGYRQPHTFIVHPSRGAYRA